MDFKSPDFSIEIHATRAPSAEGFLKIDKVESDFKTGHAEGTEPASEIGFSGKTEFSGEAGFNGKNRPAGRIVGKLEITELSGILRTSDGTENSEKKVIGENTEVSAANLGSLGLAPEISSERPFKLESIELSNSGSIELSTGSIGLYEPDFPQENSRASEKSPETGTGLLRDKDSGPEGKSEIKTEFKPGNKIKINPESKLETKPETKPESGLDDKPESEFPEKEPEEEIQKLSEWVKGKPGKEISGKADKPPEEKPFRAMELTGKTGKTGQKKGKPAVPRQYNLGDYL